MIHARNCRYFVDQLSGASFRVLLRALIHPDGSGAYRYLGAAVFETMDGTRVGSVLPIRGTDFPWLTRGELAHLLEQAVAHPRPERSRVKNVPEG